MWSPSHLAAAPTPVPYLSEAAETGDEEASPVAEDADGDDEQGADGEGVVHESGLVAGDGDADGLFEVEDESGDDADADDMPALHTPRPEIVAYERARRMSMMF